MSNTVAIIGGGAAGMMCACVLQEAAGAGTEILLFEKNAYLGAKVLISGGGRCNVTTGIFDVKKLLENYPRGARFLMSAMFRFPPEKVVEWFENHGVKMKTEDDLRIFPVSNEGREVVAALEREMRGGKRNQNRGAKIYLNSNIVEIQKIDGAGGTAAAGIRKKVLGIRDVRTKTNAGRESGGMGQSAASGVGAAKFLITLKNGKTFEADKVVLTSGGNAYSHTGSTGDGYDFAKNLGHSITELAPSLSSFVIAEKFLGKAAGISFQKVGMILKSNHGQRTYKRTGPFLFTHSGISGPAIFALSSMSAYENYNLEEPMTLNINFFPDEKAEDLEKRIVKLINEHGKKRLINLLDLILPKSLCQVFLEYVNKKNGAGAGAGARAGAGTGAKFLDLDLFAAKISREQRKIILNALQNFELTVIGRGAGDEFVTAGGVDLKEINPNTMESKICPGLFFAGEILDVDGFTGGFNLQAAWATGRLAGESAAEN